jgi:hypothetical protein
VIKAILQQRRALEIGAALIAVNPTSPANWVEYADAAPVEGLFTLPLEVDSRQMR